MIGLLQTKITEKNVLQTKIDMVYHIMEVTVFPVTGNPMGAWLFWFTYTI